MNSVDRSDTDGQSAGSDPRAKRNSGLFSFLRWFKTAPTSSRESLDSDTPDNSTSDSCDSIDSTVSTGTVTSFSFVSPAAYKNHATEKTITPGPETDTYKARLKQRDRLRERDGNISLRKKYNLFFNHISPKATLTTPKEEDNSKSLPLMTKREAMHKGDEEKIHRRTASESSKIKKAGAYCHVKGKRKAPQPPNSVNNEDDENSTGTSSLRRRKRLAPKPPCGDKNVNAADNEKMKNGFEYADADVIFNDSLKLDHGILKPAKEIETAKTAPSQSPSSSARSSYVEAPVSPRPWYKRNSKVNHRKDRDEKSDHRYEPIEVPLELRFSETEFDKKDERRKSGMSFLTNISELDREASEIVKKDTKNESPGQMPAFMRPKQEEEVTDTMTSPKRRSAKDLIAKFNAITNVTKVSVFGVKETGMSQKEKRDYFGRVTNKSEENSKKINRTTNKNTHQRKNDVNDNNLQLNPLMKSESASVIKMSEKKEPIKTEKKCWSCPKCSLENDYWRINCSVCSTIKPHFNNVSSYIHKSSNSLDKDTQKSPEPKSSVQAKTDLFERNLERSKTQIGFSAFTKHNEGKAKKIEKSTDVEDKKEEHDKLIKMLIEIKNSLPKRKLSQDKQGKRKSVIEESPEIVEYDMEENVKDSLNKNLEHQDDNIKQNASKKEINVIEKESKNIEASKLNKNEQSIIITKGNNDKKPRLKTEVITQIGTDLKNDKIEKNSHEIHEGNTSVTVVTTETIYENIKVKKSENVKPLKVSSSAQTSAVIRKTPSASGAVKKDSSSVRFEPMKPKDFADIYNEKTGKGGAHVYANLAKNDDMSLFINMPKGCSDLRTNFDLNNLPNNKDTLEINRLLRRLETSIAKGELTEAAIFARELAQLKVNCSVIRQKAENKKQHEAKHDAFT